MTILCVCIYLVFVLCVRGEGGPMAFFLLPFHWYDLAM